MVGTRHRGRFLQPRVTTCSGQASRLGGDLAQHMAAEIGERRLNLFDLAQEIGERLRISGLRRGGASLVEPDLAKQRQGGAGG